MIRRYLPQSETGWELLVYLLTFLAYLITFWLMARLGAGVAGYLLPGRELGFPELWLLGWLALFVVGVVAATAWALYQLVAGQ